MKNFVSFLPKKQYQWTLLFYGSLVLFIIWIAYISAIVVGLFGFLGLGYIPQVFVSLLLSLLAAIYLVQIIFRLYHIFQKKRKIILKGVLINTVLFFITIPIVVSYISLGVAALKVLVEPVVSPIWGNIVYRDYENVSYQVLDSVPAFCYLPGSKIDDYCGIAITTKQEYQRYTSGKHSSFPDIDFDRNILLINTVRYGDCDVINTRVYRDDTNNKILHITTIRKTRESFLNGCSLVLISRTGALLVPKSFGYTVEFQVRREENN